MFSYEKKLGSFRSYQLVEADLLVYMPARGDRMKVRFDEIDKTLRAYIIFQQHPQIPKNIDSVPDWKEFGHSCKSADHGKIPPRTDIIWTS